MVEVEGAGGVEDAEDAAEDAAEDVAEDATEDATEDAAEGAAADVAAGVAVDAAVDVAVDVVAGVVVVADAGDAAAHAVSAEEEDDSVVQPLVKGIEELAEGTTAAAVVAAVLAWQSGLVEPEVGTALEAASEYVGVGMASPTSKQLPRESQLEEPPSHPSA